MDIYAPRNAVTYFNGKRYVRRLRRSDTWHAPQPLIRITFAYRGVPDEWPVIIGYRIR